MHHVKRFNTRLIGLTGLALTLGCAALAPAAQAQAPGGEAIAKTALGFLSTGGYFITGSARHAIGSTKFYSQGAFYTRPRQVGPLNITGGVELIGVQDHFFPFTGGDHFTLIGPGFRVTTTQDYHGIQPFFSGGLFYGELRSVQLGFDKSAIIPSISVGVDYKLTRNVSLSASYRVSQDLGGYNTDGFGVFVKLF